MSRRSTVTLAIASVAIFMVTLDNLVVTTALPSIRRDLGASLEDLEWTVNAYTLAFAVFLLTGAALGDRFGRRRMFLIGIATFTGASAFAALAPSTDALIAPPRPCTALATFSTSIDGASAAAADAAVKMPSPTASIRRRPKRSPSAAPVSSRTANVRV